MKQFLLAAMLIASPAAAITIPSTEGSIFDSIAAKVSHYIQGFLYVGQDSTHTTPKIILSGTDGSVSGSSATFTYNVNASSFNGTLNGNVNGNLIGSNSLTVSTITAGYANLGGAGGSYFSNFSGFPKFLFNINALSNIGTYQAGVTGYSSLVEQDVAGTGNLYYFMGNSVSAGATPTETVYQTITPSGSIGFHTLTPGTTFDVNGTAQFGFGATKSTFSANGDLTIAPGSFLSVGFTPSTPHTTQIQSGGSIVMAAGAPITMSGAGADITTSAGIITASAFHGDGSALTGLGATGACTVGASGLGSVQCNGSGATNVSTSSAQNAFAGPGSNVSAGISAVTLGAANYAGGLNDWADGVASSATAAFGCRAQGTNAHCTTNGSYVYAVRDDGNTNYYDHGSNTYSIKATAGIYLDSSTVNVSASGPTTFSISTSSGIHILAGGVTYPDGTTAITASGAASLPGLPTRQVFTSGSGTYTTPASTRQLRIRMVGAGGGGAAVTANAGGFGGYSTFNAISAAGGGGGAIYNAGTNTGSGGTGGAGSASFRIQGGGADSVNGFNGGAGGNSAFGGGAMARGTAAGTGLNGATNSGGGGGGGSSSQDTGQGGGAGEYIEIIINSPTSTYSYAVGASGAGGLAGTQAGGNGGSGIIIVDEFY